MKTLIWPNSKLRICTSFACNFKCDYCSVSHYQEDLCKVSEYAEEELPYEKWVERLKYVKPSRPMTVVFGAGEPPLYKGLPDIINSISFNTLVFSNASSYSVKQCKAIRPRDSLSFYISYHPTQIDCDEFIRNAKWFKDAFNVINFHTPQAPSVIERSAKDAIEMKKHGIVLNTSHPFLEQKPGSYHFYDELGEMKKFKDRFSNRIDGTPKRKVLCKTSFNHASTCNTMGYPVAPNGDIYVCWRYLLNHSKEGIIGNFFEEDFEFVDAYFECDHYGDCNMCGWDKNILDKETKRQLDTDVIHWVYLDKAKKKGNNSISVCMIVKDEEEVIAKALESVDAIADEIIFVDTGSTDKTLEIVNEFKNNGCHANLKIKHYKWRDNFAAARNFSISKATKEWVLILDADERLDANDAPVLKQILADIEENLVVVDLISLYDKGKSPRSRFSSFRIFRRSANPRYVGRVHNMPLIPANERPYRIPCKIYHIGYDLSDEKMEEKRLRRISMCKKWTKDEPDDIRAWFQYVRALKVKAGDLNREAKDEIFYSLGKAIELADGKNDSQNVYLQTLCDMAWMKHFFQEHHDAIKYGKMAVAIKNDYLDAILVVGMANTYGANVLEGEIWLKKYLEEQSKYDFNRIDCISMEKANEKGAVYRALAQIEEAKNKHIISEELI